MRCQDVKDPHTFSWVAAVEHGPAGLRLPDGRPGPTTSRGPRSARSGRRAPTSRPGRSGSARPSSGTTAGSSRPTTSVWNIKRVLDPKTGSSVLGLMKGFILDEFETGEKDDKGNPKKSTPPLGRERGPEGRRLHRPAQRQDAADRRAGVAVPLPVPDPRPGGERRVQGGVERDGGVRAGREPAGAEAGPQGPEGLLGRRPLPRHPRVHRSRGRRRRARSRRSRASRSTASTRRRSPSSTRSRSSATSSSTRSRPPRPRSRAYTR